jgi:hypothetical protein
VLPTDRRFAARTGWYGAVHGVRAAGEDSQTSGRSAWGRSMARNGGLPWAARTPRRAARAVCATSRRDDALTENVLLSPCLKLIYSKILY